MRILTLTCILFLTMLSGCNQIIYEEWDEGYLVKKIHGQSWLYTFEVDGKLTYKDLLIEETRAVPSDAKVTVMTPAGPVQVEIKK